MSVRTTSRASARRRLVAGLATVAGIAGAAGGSAAAGKAPVVSNCLWELARGRSAALECSYPAWLADKERGELRRLTRERLQDARCTVSIRIERALVVRAMTSADFVFEAPPQPVTCEIVTRDKPVPIEATFAPRVVIKDGVAVDATPGLANVTGVNSYLAWPVVEYVNRSATVKAEMLKMINSYLALRVARGG